MKTRHLLKTVLFLLITTQFVLAQTDVGKLDLKGNVKSVDIINYLAVEKFGEVVKKGITDGEQYEFNEAGFATRKMVYGEEGKPVEQRRFLYDESNNQIEQNVSDIDGKLKRRIINVFNEYDNKTYETVYGSDGNLIRRSVYTFKDGVTPKKVVTYDGRGSELLFKNFKFDKKKSTKVEIFINPRSKLVEKAMKYDKNENLIESRDFDVEEKVTSKFVYEYNDTNSLTSSRFYRKEVLMVKRMLTYNNLGFVVRIIEKYPQQNKKNVITFSYDFDEKKNWTKKIEFLNSIPIKINERNILYF